MKFDEDALRERLWKCKYAYKDFVEGTIYKVKDDATEKEYLKLMEILADDEIDYSEVTGKLNKMLYNR